MSRVRRLSGTFGNGKRRRKRGGRRGGRRWWGRGWCFLQERNKVRGNVSQVEARYQVEARRPGNTPLTPPCEALFFPTACAMAYHPTTTMVELTRYRPLTVELL